MKKLLLILIALSVVLFLFVFNRLNFRESSPSTFQSKPTILFAGQILEVDISDTPFARSMGLSGKNILEENQGMLFIFDTPGPYGFWMKDMNFSIDIIWFDSERRAIHIEEGVSPESYPKVFSPKEKTSQFVLEVSSGFSERYQVSLGDTFEFLP